MKALALISTVLCTMVIAAIAAPRSVTPVSEHASAGNEWWGAQAHRASITVPSRPADFRYGLTGNDWWAAQGKRPHN